MAIVLPVLVQSRKKKTLNLTVSDIFTVSYKNVLIFLCETVKTKGTCRVLGQYIGCLPLT